MWGEPRPGTEADLVKKQAEAKQKAAKSKGLDKLLIEVYHSSIKYYPHWIADARNKRYVHSSVTSAVEKAGDKKIDADEIREFVFGDRSYRITRGGRYTPYRMPDDEDRSEWYKLALYLNGKKVFAVTEEQTHDEWSSYEHPISVDAYLSDEWVEDFRSIKAHKEKVDAQVKLEYAEDPRKVKELRENFGIENSVSELKRSAGAPTVSTGQDKSQAIWVIIGVAIIIYLMTR